MSDPVPDGWISFKLDDVANEISDRVDNPSKSVYDRFVGLEHLDSGKLTVRRWGSTAALLSAMKLFKSGDILIGRRNAYLKRASKAEFDGVCSGDAYVVRERKGKIAEGLLPIILNSDPFWDYTIAHASGTMSKRAKWRDLAEYSFLLPPPEEQRRIATTLWAAENCIVKGERFVAAAERAKQMLMRELFSNGIGYCEFKDVEGFGKIPNHWRIEKLTSLTTSIGDGLHGTPDYVDNSPFHFINGNNLSNGHIIITASTRCVSANEFKKYTIPLDENSVLMSINGTIGNLALYGGESIILGKSAAYITCNNTLLRKYLYFLLQSKTIQEIFRRELTGSTIFNLSLESIRNLLIPVPPLLEQRQIAAILTRCDETIAAASTNVTAAKALKMKMINKMLDPNAKF